MVRRLGFRPLVLVFGLSVAFCGARRLLALIYYAPRKIGSWRGKEGSTVRRIGLRPIVLVFGLPLVVLRCKTTASLPIFASRKIGSWCRKEAANKRYRLLIMLIIMLL